MQNKYALYICGAAYYQLKDYNNAQFYFEQCLRLDISFVNALFALAMTLKKLNEITEAIKIFERIIAIDPGNKMALFEAQELKKQTPTSNE